MTACCCRCLRVTTNTLTGVLSPLWLRLHHFFHLRDDFPVGHGFLITIGLLGKMMVELGCLTGGCFDRPTHALTCSHASATTVGKHPPQHMQNPMQTDLTDLPCGKRNCGNIIPYYDMSYRGKCDAAFLPWRMMSVVVGREPATCGVELEASLLNHPRDSIKAGVSTWSVSISVKRSITYTWPSYLFNSTPL